MTNEELVALIQAGERDRLPELWGQVERFVAFQANKRIKALALSGIKSGVEYNDLYHSGYIALVGAVDTYDPEPGASFITWLVFYLKTAFAEAGGYRTKRQARDPLRLALSMDAPVKAGADDGDKAAFGDFIPDPKAAQALRDVDDSICRAQTRQAVQRALEQLPVAERLAVKAYYYEGRTQREAGRETLERAEIHLRRLLSNQREAMLV